MLIQCTECLHYISDKADKCPNCGCPMEDILNAINEQKELIKSVQKNTDIPISGNICVINGKEYDLTPVIPFIDHESSEYQSVHKVQKITKLDFTNAGCIVDHMALKREIPKTYNPLNMTKPKLRDVPDNIGGVKCPYCGSTSTKKIGTGSRIASTAFFGLASNKIGKSYKCTKCGCTF